MATLKDIAAKCGVSIATVSYIMSGRADEKRISLETRSLVMKAAEELGYRYVPKPSRGGPPKIAVFWPQKHLDMLIPSFIRGMNSALCMAANPVDVNLLPFEQDFLARHQALWKKDGYDAAVIVSASMTDLEELSGRQTPNPTVLLNRKLPGYSSVTIDHEEAGKMAAVQAIERAGSDIMLVIPNANLYGAITRGRAVSETCMERGVDLSGRVIYCNNDMDDGYAVGQKLLLEKSVPGAIICVYDMTAFGIACAMNDAGVRVGKDIDVISMSTSYDKPISRIFAGLTVIDLRQTEVSNMGMNVAIDMAVHRLTEPREHVLHPQLIHR